MPKFTKKELLTIKKIRAKIELKTLEKSQVLIQKLLSSYATRKDKLGTGITVKLVGKTNYQQIYNFTRTKLARTNPKIAQEVIRLENLSRKQLGVGAVGLKIRSSIKVKKISAAQLTRKKLVAKLRYTQKRLLKNTQRDTDELVPGLDQTKNKRYGQFSVKIQNAKIKKKGGIRKLTNEEIKQFIKHNQNHESIKLRTRSAFQNEDERAAAITATYATYLTEYLDGPSGSSWKRELYQTYGYDWWDTFSLSWFAERFDYPGEMDVKNKLAKKFNINRQKLKKIFDETYYSYTGKDRTRSKTGVNL